MARMRIAVLAVALFSIELSAQPAPHGNVTVQVTDMSGAPIPGALVNIGADCDEPVGGETDQNGEINLDPRPGPWDNALTVTHPGFCPEMKTIQILDQPAQMIPVKLQLAKECTGKCACVSAEPSGTTQPAPGRIIIQAEDMNGGALPNARVEVDPSLSTPGPVAKTDSQGLASFDLPGGIHAITVTEEGFYKWVYKVEILGLTGRNIEAMLRVASICDVWVVPGPVSDFPLETPDPIFLPLHSLLNLAPLPTRPAKRRR